MGFAYLGELAGLGTAVCWTVTSMSFEAAGKRVGSLAVNLIRLVMALLVLALVNWARRGLIWPLDASGHAWLWLSVSGIVGFTIGDLCLFRAFVLIGARLSMLMMSLVPLITALGSWLIIGERLEWLEWLGMALTLTGVAWVVLERQPDPAGRGRRPPLRGVLLGMGGAAGQALGLVLSKYGMGDYDALAANQIRVFSGMLAYCLLFCVIGWWSRVGQALRHPSGMGFTALGAFFGPFLGVSLSLLAVQNTEAGVAATLMALVPVIILAPARLIQREPISPRAVGGALLAVAGSALLFLT